MSDGDEATKTDPGASRHGNFMNYYQFHPAEERVRQLPRGVWRVAHPARKYAGLDVGCNAGVREEEEKEEVMRGKGGGEASTAVGDAPAPKRDDSIRDPQLQTARV